MIEILHHNYRQKVYSEDFEQIIINDDIISIQFLNYGESEKIWLKNNFNIDLSIFQLTEDIEISSHYIKNKEQISIQFSIPFYNSLNEFKESQVTLILMGKKVFTFIDNDLDKILNQFYLHKINFDKSQPLTYESLILQLISVFSDYYADLTELISKRIKNLANRLLLKNEFGDTDLDIITKLNFNNLLIKESANEFKRILVLIKKGKIFTANTLSEIDEELIDLSVVTEYIQFNFDRLDDLKDNISNKIDLEQNRIFKILTIVTVTIAMPTFFAGLYGMNFKFMPELTWKYGYIYAISIMLLSIAIPLIIFKKKKWIS